jgi:hypothetical protein
MLPLSKFLNEQEAPNEIELLRTKYFRARLNFQNSLEKFSLQKVNGCTSCYEKLFEGTKERIMSRMFTSDFEPDELEVLNELYVQNCSN